MIKIPKWASKLSGIYQITNLQNGKKYVGSALNLHIRWGVHRSDLRRGVHHSRALQDDWDQMSEEAFEFKILLVCDPENLLSYEQLFLDTWDLEYNTHPKAGSALGVKRTQEHKDKTSRSLMGHEVSSETRRKLAEANLGKKHTAESRKKMSESHKGKVFSPEHRANLSKSKLGNKNRLDIPHTEEAKEKIREARRSPEARRRVSEVHKGKIVSKETRRKMSEAAKRRWRKND